MTHDVSFTDDFDENMEQDSIISNEEIIASSSMMLSRTNQLDIIDLSYYTFNQGFFDMICYIQAAVRITCLNITLDYGIELAVLGHSETLVLTAVKPALILHVKQVMMQLCTLKLLKL
ncbi:unnamed protein product [Rotaria sordida]|uniref:Uncharacterized protein n=1 Tax=Rotaria sordida TaxID=392033 RepID=A0A814VKT4_9BILA|nr:unnamed protein product [Rotaria sordida]CAF3961086.1 unnamed protein product [Rotaria sordida]